MTKTNYEPIVGIWVKAKPKHITTFIENWENFKESQAFCVYDLPPILPYGSLIFLHAIDENKLLAYAQYVGYDIVEGWIEYDKLKSKLSKDALWYKERDRIWSDYTYRRLHTHNKNEFDRFWIDQMGVRGVFIMGNVIRLDKNPSWSESMNILQIHRPLGFSYRFLYRTQVERFLRLIGVKARLEIIGIESPKVIISYRD